MARQRQAAGSEAVKVAVSVYESWSYPIPRRGPFSFFYLVDQLMPLIDGSWVDGWLD